ncbi:MAG TPA: metallophosphoesterase [Savagea sp.]
MIVVISDTHGDRTWKETIVRRHAPEHIWHCGDSELSPNDPIWDGVTVVCGNNDRRYERSEEGEWETIPWWIVHGHEHDVYTSLLRLSYGAEERGSRLVCFGHTHMRGAERIERTLFVNPGSYTRPRGSNEPTYATLERNGSSIHVTWYTPDGQCVTSVSFEKMIDNE